MGVHNWIVAMPPNNAITPSGLLGLGGDLEKNLLFSSVKS